MPTMTIEYRTEVERATIERAVAFAAEMHDLAVATPAGSVLNACEGLAVGAGRDLLHEALRGAVQARGEAAEQKMGPPATARAADGSASSASATEPCRPPSGRSAWAAGIAPVRPA